MAKLSQNSAEPTPRHALAFIFSVAVLDLLGLTLLLPVIPFLVRQYNAGAIYVTLMTVVYAAAQFLAAPWLGRLSDRYGRKPTLLICLLGSALGYVLFGLGGALWVLLLSRLIDGVTGGNIAIVSAYIADITPPEERAKNFGLIGMAFGIGFIFGPALGGALSRISLAAPAFAAGALSLLAVLVGLIMLPESLPPARRATGSITLGEINPFASIWSMLRRSTLGTLLLVQCLFIFAFDGINTTGGVFAMDKFAITPFALGMLFVLIGVVLAATHGLIGQLTQRFGEKQLAVVGFGTMSIAQLATFLAPAFWLWFPLGALASMAAGLIYPTMGAMIANSVSQNEQGQVNGVSMSLTGLMTALGPLAAGVAYDHLMPGAPYWIGTLLFVIAALMLLRISQMARPEVNPATGLLDATLEA
jgi:MFS family permease